MKKVFFIYSLLLALGLQSCGSEEIINPKSICLCCKHGGYWRCNEEGCEKAAKAGGMCIAHGGSQSSKKPCEVEGCSTLAALHGLCFRHGGYYRCKEEGCEKVAKKGGMCIAHGRSGGISRT